MVKHATVNRSRGACNYRGCYNRAERDGYCPCHPITKPKPFKYRPGGFLETLGNFLADPTGLTQKEIVEELEEQGIDVNRLKDRVKEIVKKGLNQNRRQK